MPQTAEREQGNVFDMLRFQRIAKRVAVELGVMARTRHRADVRETSNAIGVQKSDKIFNRQRRMPDRENSAVGPMYFLRGRLLAHGADRRVSSIRP